MGSNYAHVKKYRENTKRKLIEAHGGCCRLCGYDRCHRALEFHHVDPSTKSFSISANRKVMGFERLNEEAKKCILVCSNCHQEIEAGLFVGDW